MKPTLLISILYLGYYVRTSYALPILCSNESPGNILRLRILDRIHSNALSLAESLKLKTSSHVSDLLKQLLDHAAPPSGFPSISSTASCSDCNQTSCFEEDLAPIENLMRFINSYMSSSYSTEIVSITSELSVIRELMGGDAINMSNIFQLKSLTQNTDTDYIAAKDTDYIIAKDTFNFINKLKQRYETRV
ncbi:Hypothetical predicted protein [Mytilus galloprovincialis]|uniref:Uncharacterized protein n=1 Tax=Mytilus galloprovincialis TaxID=29158 RepID=A0A8B6GC62_MYTGA|nr:Hypothetical predicted protein [Mytilus galloprovincialis]